MSASECESRSAVERRWKVPCERCRCVEGGGGVRGGEPRGG